MVLHAVVVGVDRYRDPRIADLSWARRDAEAVAELVEQVHPSQRRVTLLLDEEATRRNVHVEIGERLAGEATEDDLVLLYFACHGSPETSPGPNGVDRYLVLHDTEYDHVYATGLSMERELPWLFERITGPPLVVLLVDACFSGRAGGRTFEGPRLRAARASDRAGGTVSLSELELGEGRLMVGACDDDQVARESAELGHGVFTHYLLKGPSAADEGFTVGVHRLYEEVAAAVAEHTGGRQVPVINGRSARARLPYLW
ncbi:caspase family protein [Streptomyces roseolilacinus]|uniref:caspase family protein n=1 Tax=Streptomyces roseolilacinus TaxID=66904 RepID=UPI0016767B4C|nr:caspase family protein [Streptomyces roseolilacinus]